MTSESKYRGRKTRPDKSFCRAKARDDTYKEITKELEKLTVEENRIRDEALAKARARALKKKVELAALTDEQLAEVCFP